jgi:hypothetical protein
MNSILSIFKSKYFYIGILRYGLALIMIGYGIIKMKGVQGGFLTPGSSWQLPLEALDGSQIIWSFVGYSRWFQFLLGALEFIPACLLLFRRTQLLGALLMLPMTLGVFFVNFALDLWQFTKIGSSLLLTVNVIILLSHRQKLKAVARMLLTTTNKRKYGWVEVAINILLIAFMSRKLFTPFYHDERAHFEPFCGDCFNHHPNEWILIKETQNDSLLLPVNLRCYFTPRGAYSEINDQNNSTAYLMYQVDPKTSTLSIEKGPHFEYWTFLLPNRQDTAHYTNFTFTFTGDSLLTLKNNNNHTWVFRRRIINEGRF